MTLGIPVGMSAKATPLTFDEATELTESIRESVADIEAKVIRAYYGRVWVAMEYESWDDYVQGEFKRAPLALPREERQTQVASLRQQGFSLRAIASVTGVDPVTVKNDLAGVENSTPDSVTGIDGKTYRSSDGFDALVAEYPRATDLPKRARSEALAGYQALAALDEREQPRRREIFARWIDAEIGKGDSPPANPVRQAELAAHEVSVALASVSVAANRLAAFGDDFHGIEANWPDLIDSARQAIARIEELTAPTTSIRRIK